MYFGGGRESAPGSALLSGDVSANAVFENAVPANAAVAESGNMAPNPRSTWRREIDPKIGRRAVQVARQSEQFHKVAAETRGARPDYLGDLEAVSWTPPCESGLKNWTIDVWYLMYLDAAVGKGRSFLVDVEGDAVVGVREFVVRSG